MSSKDDSNTPKAWRELGQALGGFARRVGKIVDDLQETARLPEEIRSQLDALAGALAIENFDACARQLSEAGPVADWSVELAGAAILTRLHCRLVEGELPAELVEAIESRDDEALSERPETALWRAYQALERNEALECGDALRRARRRREQLTRRWAEAFDDLASLIEGEAHLLGGYPQRAERTLMTRLARRGDFEGTRIDLIFTERAVDVWLALDRVDAAQEHRARLEGRIKRASKTDPDASEDELDRAKARAERFEASRPRLEALWARVDCARGDRSAATVWLEAYDAQTKHESWQSRTALRLALAGGHVARAKGLALEALKAAPSDPDALRAWALADLADGERMPPWSQDAAKAKAAIESLWPRAEKLVGWARREALREIALVALHAGVWDLANDRRIRDEKEPTPELTLLRLGALLQSPDDDALKEIGSLLRRDRAGSEPPLRLPRVEGPHGPDELSPLRQAEAHDSALAAHAHYIASLALRAEKRAVPAHKALVDALIECPDLRVAREALVRSAPVEDDGRIESLLSEATRRLGKLPRELSGVTISGVDEALERVVAIRERLARPLTIAIMGEFSSGKSTFVNAWLGRRLAPMGALPTTCTINVFRHGGQGAARIHRRDGRIELVQSKDLLGFLDGLDEESARSIRHVEIERGDLGGGHASIVDTPGLNALDAYHEEVAREFLAEADAVVWIFSATQGAAASERAMLDELRGDGRRVLGILNKVDILEAGEDGELMDYLRDKLGEVLVDVLPLSAQGALDWRESQSGESDALGGPNDPMRAVDEALESHFLANARELKVEICRRELADALEAALAGLDGAADHLERESPVAASIDLPRLRTQLSKIVDAIGDSWAEGADTLNRELMALGVYEPQRGANEGRPDAYDRRYFASRLSRVAGSAMAAKLFAMRAQAGEDLLLDAVGESLGPWLNGYLEGLADAGALDEWLAAVAKASAQGEDAARLSLADHFSSMATLAHKELSRHEGALLASLRADARRRSGRGVAEALGLRALGETQVRPLLQLLDSEDAATS